jgi:phage tail-like protein
MRSLSTDPLRNFKFQVQIMPASDSAGMSPNLGRLGFMTVSGLGIQNEVIPYREGGDNTTTRKMPGQTDFGPITMGRGSAAAPVGPNSTGSIGTSDVYNWLGQVFSVLEGGGTNDGTSDFRADVLVDILEHPVTKGNSAAGINSPAPVKLRFHIFNAWPMAISWSDLDAGGNAIVIESLQLAHEGFIPIYGGNTIGAPYVTALT